MNKNIGFIGFGEAAYNICIGFKEEGLKGIKAFDVLLEDKDKSQILEKRLSGANVEPIYSIKELVNDCEIMFLAVPAKFAKGAAENVLDFMTEGKILIDITTNRPHIKKELGDLYKNKGMLYADASVMGAVPLYKHKTPILVCGNGANKMINLLTPIGMDLTYVGEEAGIAVKMKLTRSIFVKGLEALTLETLQTARKLGIEEEIMDGLNKSFEVQGFTKMVSQLVISNLLHSKRRAIEAEECAELEKELGFVPIMIEAAQKKLEWSAALGLSELEESRNCKTLGDLYNIWESRIFDNL